MFESSGQTPVRCTRTGVLRDDDDIVIWFKEAGSSQLIRD
jgi:hypothetical protein